MPDPRTLSEPAVLPGRYRLRRGLLALSGRLLQPEAPRPASAPLRRVLLIRPDHLGDVLLATPAFALLRAALPDAHITALVGPWAAEVAERNPYLDAVLTLPFPGFTRAPSTNLLDPYRLARTEARRLQAFQFDAAVILRPDHWWGGLLAALARIPQRVGYATPDLAPFLTDTAPYAPDEHVTRLNLTLISRLTGCSVDATPGHPPTLFPLHAAERDAADAWLTDRGVNPADTLIAIHPGAGARVKLWTAERWAAVADALAADGARTLLTGGPDEAVLTAEVARLTHAPAIDAAGATSLGLLAALFERCALVLGVDAGALHLATAVGAPTVRLYGPINPRLFGPWGDPHLHRVVVAMPPLACQFCQRLDYSDDETPLHPCVRWITVDQTLAAARRPIAP